MDEPTPVDADNMTWPELNAGPCPIVGMHCYKDERPAIPEGYCDVPVTVKIIVRIPDDAAKDPTLDNVFAYIYQASKAMKDEIGPEMTSISIQCPNETFPPYAANR